jgi:hypothetical protein
MKKTKLKELVNCRDCMDEKVCPACRGSGIDRDEDGPFDCAACDGTGRCCWCDEAEKK